MIELNREKLVSACGIYCGACHRYKKKSCSGCKESSKLGWCKVRVCASESGYHTCAECVEHTNVMDCKKFNSFFSKLFALIFRSDRKASLDRISEVGLVRYSREMSFKDKPVIKYGE